ncbi:IS66 family insertion sequence element accessory protein TnpB [Leptospira inadai]|uniref:IS66 family insertion sequence element accessory protein TnpB n=1 Tax=Leptospira inadai TaxID=29506 RepID=UPI003B51076D
MVDGRTDMRNRDVEYYSEKNVEDVYSDICFVCAELFCGKSRDRLKCLYWDGNGFCIWQKRLEKGKFPWPESEESALDLSWREVSWLLKGIDFRKEHRLMDVSGLR